MVVSISNKLILFDYFDNIFSITHGAIVASEYLLNIIHITFEKRIKV